MGLKGAETKQMITRREIEIPEPDNYSAKEVFTFFGLAAYQGQVLEKGLVNLILVFQARGLRITRPEIDALFYKLDRKTFGQLLNRARDIVPIPKNTDNLLGDALRKRNWLAHNFFADRAVEFSLEDGRAHMIRELQTMVRLFQQANEASYELQRDIMSEMGLDEEWIEKQARAMQQKYIDSQRDQVIQQ